MTHTGPKPWFLDRDGDESEILKKASHGDLVSARNIPADINNMENEASTGTTATLQGVGSAGKDELPEVKVSYTEYVDDARRTRSCR